MSSALAQSVVAAKGSLELVLPRCEKGIGTAIVDPRSADLIEGVAVEPYPIWPDDRGYFLEVARLGEGVIRPFAAASTQISVSLSYPGTIKAFHFHLEQSDYWVVAKGMLQVALVDLRRGSRTFGARNTVYIGVLRPWRLLIPPGVAHGYKVIGEEPAVLVYVTDRHYNRADEGRLPYDEPGIHYDWELQHK